MRPLVACVLTAVIALTICTLSEPAVVKPERPVPYRSPPPQPPQSPTGNPASRGRPGLLTGIDIFFSPYGLLNIDRSTYEKPIPSAFDYKPKMVWITKVRSKDIDRINELRDQEAAKTVNDILTQYRADNKGTDLSDVEASGQFEITYDYRTLDYGDGKESRDENDMAEKKIEINSEAKFKSSKPDDEKKKEFAVTPHDKEFFEAEPKENSGEEEDADPFMMRRRGDGFDVQDSDPGFEDVRQIRQNPNKIKTLIEHHLDVKPVPYDTLRSQIPVSLVPTNLQRLKVLQRNHAEARARQITGATRPSLLEADSVQMVLGDDGPFSLYAIAVFTAMGTALCVAVVGITFGWYTLSRKAKAAADVDYPAYGVTGPSVDHSGDRKLAHSAHMYHYQHQKQQIIAMERNGSGSRNDSVSDPESEEENEEGDYTVYECPGYATTGDMEVKNPMFTDDPTPQTPATATVAPSPTIIVDDNTD